MKDKDFIVPCIWFSARAEESVKYYSEVFKNSGIVRVARFSEVGKEMHRQEPGSIMSVEFKLDGQTFLALNGCPDIKPNPATSLFAIFETEREIKAAYEALSKGGKVLMPLDRYEWAENYSWFQDQYGISWQLMQTKWENVGCRLSSLFFFTGDVRGRAEEAINFYLSIFENSSIDGVAHYGPENKENEGLVMHAQFRVGDQVFMAMDSGEKESIYPFNESFTHIISCTRQEEVDHYWESLSADGGTKGHCGWLKDKFGIWWQVVPDILPKLLTDPDFAKARSVNEAMMKMGKLDFDKLREAHKNAK